MDPVIDPEIVEMAKTFAGFDAEQQAQFFDALYIEVTTAWDGGLEGFRTQMRWAYLSSNATPGGHRVMEAIGAEAN